MGRARMIFCNNRRGWHPVWIDSSNEHDCVARLPRLQPPASCASGRGATGTDRKARQQDKTSYRRPGQRRGWRQAHPDSTQRSRPTDPRQRSSPAHPGSVPLRRNGTPAARNATAMLLPIAPPAPKRATFAISHPSLNTTGIYKSVLLNTVEIVFTNANVKRRKGKRWACRTARA